METIIVRSGLIKGGGHVTQGTWGFMGSKDSCHGTFNLQIYSPVDAEKAFATSSWNCQWGLVWHYQERWMFYLGEGKVL